MRRTNLLLDEALLEEAARLSGARTQSGAAQKALRDFVRRAKAHRILELRGSGPWEADLGEVRRDRLARRGARR